MLNVVKTKLFLNKGKQDRIIINKYLVLDMLVISEMVSSASVLLLVEV